MHHLSDKQDTVTVSNIHTGYSLPPGVNQKKQNHNKTTHMMFVNYKNFNLNTVELLMYIKKVTGLTN